MFYLGFRTFAIVHCAEDEYVCEFVVRYDQCLLSEMLSVFCAGVSYMRVSNIRYVKYLTELCFLLAFAI